MTSHCNLTCESCNTRCMSRMYDSDTGLMCCAACIESEEEPQVADNTVRNTTFKLNHGRLIVVHRPGTHDPYRLYRESDSVEIGYADNLHDIIELANTYITAMGA